MEIPESRPPRQFETRRLVLRRARPDEAHLLRDAVDSSLEHLRAWMPWAMNEPITLDETKARLAKSIEEFERGETFAYNLFPRGREELLGSIGLHRRSEPGTLEMGYWIRESAAGQGFVTEAAAVLARAALSLGGIECVTIECDPRNAASVRVAEKLGFVFVERRSGDKRTPRGEPRDTLVFECRDPETLPEP